MLCDSFFMTDNKLYIEYPTIEACGILGYKCFLVYLIDRLAIEEGTNVALAYIDHALTSLA